MMTGRVLLLSCSTGGPAIAATSATCYHADRLGTGRGSDLRGFGESNKPQTSLDSYGAAGQVRSLLALIDELELGEVVRGGYDVGSGVTHELARTQPEIVRAMVLGPPLPGIGSRSLSAASQREFWYQCLHHTELVEQLIDGRPEQVRSYLRHIWSRWSGPDFVVTDTDLDDLVDRYGSPGHFCASIAWYRTGPDAYDLSAPTAHTGPRSTVPLTLPWPQLDPLSPPSGPRRSTSTTPMPTSVPSTASVTSSPANNHT